MNSRYLNPFAGVLIDYDVDGITLRQDNEGGTDTIHIPYELAEQFSEAIADLVREGPKLGGA